MKDYVIGFWHSVSGRVTINAKTQKDAENKVKNLLAESGIDELKNIDYTDRNYGVC